MHWRSRNILTSIRIYFIVAIKLLIKMLIWPGCYTGVPNFEEVEDQLPLVHQPQSTEQKGLTQGGARMGEGEPTLWSVYKYNPPAVVVVKSPLHELNNPNVGLHTHVIINKLCLHPFQTPENKNKSNLPGSRWQQSPWSMSIILHSNGRYESNSTSTFTYFMKGNRALKSYLSKYRRSIQTKDVRCIKRMLFQNTIFLLTIISNRLLHLRPCLRII